MQREVVGQRVHDHQPAAVPSRSGLPPRAPVPYAQRHGRRPEVALQLDPTLTVRVRVHGRVRGRFAHREDHLVVARRERVVLEDPARRELAQQDRLRDGSRPRHLERGTEPREPLHDAGDRKTVERVGRIEVRDPRQPTDPVRLVAREHLAHPDEPLEAVVGRETGSGTGQDPLVLLVAICDAREVLEAPAILLRGLVRVEQRSEIVRMDALHPTPPELLLEPAPDELDPRRVEPSREAVRVGDPHHGGQIGEARVDRLALGVRVADLAHLVDVETPLPATDVRHGHVRAMPDAVPEHDDRPTDDGTVLGEHTRQEEREISRGCRVEHERVALSEDGAVHAFEHEPAAGEVDVELRRRRAVVAGSRHGRSFRELPRRPSRPRWSPPRRYSACRPWPDRRRSAAASVRAQVEPRRDDVSHVSRRSTKKRSSKRRKTRKARVVARSLRFRSVRTKLMTSFLAIAAVVAVVGVFGMTQQSSIAAKGKAIYSGSFTPLARISDAREGMLQSRFDLVVAVTQTGPAVDQSLSAWNAEAKGADEALAAFKAANGHGSAQESSLFDTISSNWSSYKDIAQSKAMPLLRAGDAAAFDSLRTSQILPLFNNINDAFDKLVTIQDNQAKAAMTAADSTQSSARTFTVLLIVLGVGLAAGL